MRTTVSVVGATANMTHLLSRTRTSPRAGLARPGGSGRGGERGRARPGARSDDHPHRGSGLRVASAAASVSCTRRGRSERFTLQLPLRGDRVVWDARPFVSPLVDIADRGAPTGIVLVSGDVVRLLGIEQAEPSEPEDSTFELELGDWRPFGGTAAGSPPASAAPTTARRRRRDVDEGMPPAQRRGADDLLGIRERHAHEVQPDQLAGRRGLRGERGAAVHDGERHLRVALRKDVVAHGVLAQEAVERAHLRQDPRGLRREPLIRPGLSASSRRAATRSRTRA